MAADRGQRVDIPERTNGETGFRRTEIVRRDIAEQIALAAQIAPYRLGIGILAALRKQQGFEWRDGGGPFDRLVGTPKVRAALEAGTPVDGIVAADLPAIEAWRKERQKFLLY